VLLIAVSLIFSVYLITRGARGMKKSINELKEGE
jgi:hypothetical protein